MDEALVILTLSHALLSVLELSVLEGNVESLIGNAESRTEDFGVREEDSVEGEASSLDGMIVHASLNSKMEN